MKYLFKVCFLLQVIFSLANVPGYDAFVLQTDQYGNTVAIDPNSGTVIAGGKKDSSGQTYMVPINPKIGNIYERNQRRQIRRQHINDND